MPGESSVARFAVLLLIVLAVAATSSGWLMNDGDVAGARTMQGDATGDLIVNVKDEAGRRIEGASISLVGNTSYWLTGPEGDVLIANVTAGNQTVTATKDGYISDTGVVRVDPDTVVTLNLTVRGGELAGKVRLESELGPPIANASIQVVGHPQLQTMSGSDGMYSLRGIPTGTHVITVIATGYEPLSESVDVTAGSTTLKDFGLRYLYGAISGHVKEGEQPIADARVSVTVNAQTISVLTDPAGFYRITGVPSGTYTLSASKTGYRDSSVAGVTVTNGTETTNVNMSMVSELAKLTGTVSATIALGNFLVYGAVVEIQGTGLSATTGVMGTFVIENISAGTYSVATYAEGYETNITSGVELKRGETKVLDIVLIPRPGQLTGTVRAAESNLALSGCKVEIRGPDQQMTFTDTNGQYGFAGLTPGKYTIVVTLSGYSPYIHSELTVTADSVTQHDIHMRLVKEELKGFIFGLDLPHSLMAVALIITMAILVVAVILRLKSIQHPERISEMFEQEEEEEQEEE